MTDNPIDEIIAKYQYTCGWFLFYKNFLTIAS